MNDTEIGQVIEAMNDHNPKPLGVLACAALERDLPDLEFGSVMARLVDVAAKEKYVAASDVLGGRKESSKYGSADKAWAEIASLASQADGMLGLIANIDSVKWEDPIARQALIDARRAVKTGTEETAVWAFRKAYNRLVDAGGELADTAPTAQLPTGYEPPVLRAPGRQAGKLDVSAEVARMKAQLAGGSNE